MANVIEKVSLFQKKLDQNAVRDASSGWMTQNAKDVIYHGGNEVKIPTISTEGLVDYDRNAGFTHNGSVNLSYKTYTMTQDRAQQFQVDNMDLDESGFLVAAANIMNDFQKSHVIPEIDAYRYSKFYTLAALKGRNEDVTPDAKNCFSKIKDHIKEIRKKVGYSVKLMISVSDDVYKFLSDGGAFNQGVNVGEFKGNVSTMVKSIDGCPVIPVSSTVFNTKIKIDTATPGFTNEGKDINWIISTVDAPIAISKTDKFRVFTPDVNQKADAYLIQYRVFHDLWIPEGRLDRVFVSAKPTL